ncbi:MAG: HD domain-containing protein [Peptococcaceae bacterium]|nr:HD domain-containing protein [Peptococcaceae bacterium]
MDRIERIKRDPLYTECLALNGERERDRLFCRHDFRHMLSVSRISYKIISETGNLDCFARMEKLSGTAQAVEVIRAAGLLHDMARWRQYDTGEDHALEGSRMARPVLERAGFINREIETVTRAIREHRRGGPGASYLGRVICLADDLSRPCAACRARFDCYKYEYMETIKKRNSRGFCLAGIRG